MEITTLSTDFETGVYRPPSEGGSHSLLVRFTRNCPWNRCTFCGMYKGEKFSIRTTGEIKADIDAISRICNRLAEISRLQGNKESISPSAATVLLRELSGRIDHNRLGMVFNWLLSGGKTAFLQDGNSLLMKTEHLVETLAHLRKTLPSIRRVTSYARSKTLARKPLADLEAIRRAGLDRLHVGMESGDDALLAKIQKGVTATEHVTGGRKAIEAGFQLSEYWMPGLGGSEMWADHARNTARVLNDIAPHYIRSRPIFPAPGTPLWEEQRTGGFRKLSPSEQLQELKLTVEGLQVRTRVCFDHVGNFWRDRSGGLLFSQSYEGYRFPEEKPAVLERIEEGLKVGRT